MVFLGDDILAWLVLALGGAMAVGNLLALVRPRPPGAARRGRASGDRRRGGGMTGAAGGGDRDLPRPPLGRTIVMIAVGTLAAIWALASLAVR